MSTYNEDDLRLLDRTVSIRERMINEFAAEERLTTDIKAVDTMIRLLDSTDKSIFTKAKIKLEESNQKSSEESKELLRDLLLTLHQDPNAGLVESKVVSGVVATIPEFVTTSMEVSEGELLIGEDEPDLEEYLES